MHFLISATPSAYLLSETNIHY